jgi:hypothetical protein
MRAVVFLVALMLGSCQMPLRNAEAHNVNWQCGREIIEQYEDGTLYVYKSLKSRSAGSENPLETKMGTRYTGQFAGYKDSTLFDNGKACRRLIGPKEICERRCADECQLGHKADGRGYWFCEAPK